MPPVLWKLLLRGCLEFSSVSLGPRILVSSPHSRMRLICSLGDGVPEVYTCASKQDADIGFGSLAGISPRPLLIPAYPLLSCKPFPQPQLSLAHCCPLLQITGTGRCLCCLSLSAAHLSCGDWESHILQRELGPPLVTARPSVREQRGCDGSEKRSWLWEALGDSLEGLGAHQRSRPLFVLKSLVRTSAGQSP